MHTLGTIRAFNTPNYTVIVQAEEEYDIDLSWDDDGTVAAKLDTGDLIVFCAHAKVVHTPTGSVLGEDYLGQCIYGCLEEFADHRECGRANREYERQGVNGRCGSYFKDMVHGAIAEARKNYAKMQAGKLREEI